MDWVLHNLRLLVVIGGAIAWALNQRRNAKAGGEPAKEATFDDPELAERTRRIREEIQRKIEQRAKAYTQPAVPVAPSPRPATPPPLGREVIVRAPEPAPRTKAATARMAADRTTEMLKRQATLTEQLRLAEELRAAVERRTQFETKASTATEAAAAARSALGDDLRDPAALRRAIILREILGPPLALR